MQEGRLIRVFKPGPKAQRRRGVAWPDELGTSMQIPDDCSAGELVEVVEFVQVTRHASSNFCTPEKLPTVFTAQ